MSLPVLAILGRPNVGKSTLFNRIIRKRQAIVDDMPGVTRDTQSAHAEWAGREFVVLDTGGYIPESREIIEQAVREQVVRASAEADAIVFMTDARDGVTALDLDIASILRRSQRPVVLAVNKVDDDVHEPASTEFFELGLGEPRSLSATSGRKVGDLLDHVLDILPEAKASDTDDDRVLRLAVVGRPNVGKSSLVNALLGEEKLIVTDIPGTTRDAIDTLIRHHGDEILLIDTAGLRRRSRINDAIEYFSTLRSFEAIRRCHIAVIMLDAEQGIRDQDKRILGQALSERKGVIVAVNKWDLIEKDTRTAQIFEREMRDRMPVLANVPVIFVSALTKQRVFKVLEIAKSVHRERGRKVPTPELNRFLKDMVAKNPPPSPGGKEIKINYCTQLKAGPPIFGFYANRPRLIPAHYKKFLENRLRERFGFFGVPITLLFKRK